MPVIFVNDYKDIDLKFLLSEEKKFDHLNLDKLYMNYWVELINSELKNNSKITEEIVFSKFINKYFTLSRKFIGKSK